MSTLDKPTPMKSAMRNLPMEGRLYFQQKSVSGTEFERGDHVEAFRDRRAGWPSGDIHKLCADIPVVIGAGDVERIIDIAFDPVDKAAFEKSRAAVEKLLEATRKLVVLAA
jgi:hypothetical protein